jgi:hypothetical protein
MKTLIVAICLLGFATAAFGARGFNLTWGAGCWRDDPVALKSFACDTNGGSATLTASFALDFDFSKFDYIECQLDLQSDSATLPDWWQFSGAGGCRQGALSTTANFAAAPGGCTDPWRGQTPSSTTYWETAQFPEGESGQRVPLPNRARFVGGYWVYPYVPIVRGVEYYAFSVTVDYRTTVGVGACGGCGTPSTIVMNGFSFGYTNWYTTPLSNACLRWQAAGATPCGAVPVRNTTWGQVKGLYR